MILLNNFVTNLFKSNKKFLKHHAFVRIISLKISLQNDHPYHLCNITIDFLSYLVKEGRVPLDFHCCDYHKLTNIVEKNTLVIKFRITESQDCQTKLIFIELKMHGR